MSEVRGGPKPPQTRKGVSGPPAPWVPADLKPPFGSPPPPRWGGGGIPKRGNECFSATNAFQLPARRAYFAYVYGKYQCLGFPQNQEKA